MKLELGTTVNLNDPNNLDGLPYWRNRVLELNSIVLLGLGLLTYAPSVYFSWIQGFWWIVGVDTFAFLFALFIFLPKKRSTHLKSISFVGLSYLISIMLLVNLLPVPVGYLWLFSASIMVSILFGFTYSIYALVLNALIAFLITYFVGYGFIKTGFYPLNDFNSLLATAINFVFLNSISTVSIGVMIRGIQTTNDKNLALKDQLIADQGKLVELNEQLKTENQYRVRTETALRESEKKFRIFFNHSADPIIIHDMDGNITETNAEITKFLGYSREEIIRMNIRQLVSTENTLKIDNRIKSLKKIGFNIFESALVSKYGEIIPVEVHTKLIEFDNQESVLGVVRDITERKLAESKILELNCQLESKVIERTSQFEDAMNVLRNEIKSRLKIEEELIFAKNELSKSLEKEKELNEIKSSFISMVSHEYRTPLTVILSSTYLLERFFATRDEIKFKRTMFNIQDSVDLMTKLLNDVVAMEKTGKEKTRIIRTEFDLCKSLSSIVDEIKITDKKNHSIQLLCKSNNIIVNTDENIIKQIIINLLTNATKYSPEESKITVEICTKEFNFLNIIITDNGIGIPKNEINKLFEPFQRGSNVGNTPGTGLGLSLVKKYVELLGGIILLKSELGKGTTIQLKFPETNFKLLNRNLSYIAKN